MAIRRNKYFLSLMLLGVTVIWGYTFVTVKEAIAEIPTFEFIGLRFLLASIVFFGLFGKRIIQHLDKKTFRAGIIAGVVFFAAYAFQTSGLQLTSATNAGFITGLFVVMVPFMSIFINKQMPRLSSFVGACLATGGLFLLTFRYGSILTFGDFLVLVCAAAVALHIILLSKYSPLYDVFPLAFIQMVMVSLLSFLFHLPLETYKSFLSSNVIWSLVVTGVFASAVALSVQTYAQKYLSPTRTAVIFTMEPVFAGIFGYLLLSEIMTSINFAGALAIITGIIVSELKLLNRKTDLSKESLT